MNRKLTKAEFKYLFQKSQSARKVKKDIKNQIIANKKYEETQYINYSACNGTW